MVQSLLVEFENGKGTIRGTRNEEAKYTMSYTYLNRQ